MATFLRESSYKDYKKGLMQSPPGPMSTYYGARKSDEDIKNNTTKHEKNQAKSKQQSGRHSTISRGELVYMSSNCWKQKERGK